MELMNELTNLVHVVTFGVPFLICALIVLSGVGAVRKNVALEHVPMIIAAALLIFYWGWLYHLVNIGAQSHGL